MLYKDVFHIDYYSIAYSTYTFGFCYSAQGVGFDEPVPREVADVEAALDSEMVVVDTESQRHMDMGIMAWEP